MHPKTHVVLVPRTLWHLTVSNVEFVHQTAYSHYLTIVSKSDLCHRQLLHLNQIFVYTIPAIFVYPEAISGQQIPTGRTGKIGMHRHHHHFQLHAMNYSDALLPSNHEINRLLL